MTYEEYANFFLEGSEMGCLYHEAMITRNMDWERGLQSTTYQHLDARYILNPSSTDDFANIMNTFTIGTGYYQVGTMVRYGDYIYLRTRNEQDVEPYTFYLVEYHIPTGTKIIVPIREWDYYSVGEDTHFCPIAPRTLLLYDNDDYSDEYTSRILKVIFSGTSATITTELEVVETVDIYKSLDFFDVVEGTDEHLYAVGFGYYHSQLYDPDVPTPGGWLVYCKDFSASYGGWEEVFLESVPTWDWVDSQNNWRTSISGNKIVVFAGLNDLDYNYLILSIVTFDVVTKTLVKIDDFTNWYWGYVEYVGPDLSSSNIYANYMETFQINDYPYSSTRSYIYKFDTLANTWELVRYIGEKNLDVYPNVVPYCVIFSSKTKAYFWNTITQDFYDAATNTLIGNITLPFTFGTQNTCLAIDDNNLIWFYETEEDSYWKYQMNGTLSAKDFNNDIIYNIILSNFTPKLYTNIHILNDYITLETYSGKPGKQQDYYVVKGISTHPPLPTNKFSIYVATRALGVYYTDYFHPDIYPHWTSINNGLGALDCRQFLLDSFNPSNRQYVLLEASRTLYGRQGGGNWTVLLTPAQVNDMLGSTDSSISSFCADPSIDGRLWAAVGSLGVVQSYEGYNAFYSDDYGATWNATAKISTGYWSYGLGGIVACGNNIWLTCSTGAGGTSAGCRYSSDMGGLWGNYGIFFNYISPIAFNKLFPDQAYMNAYRSDGWFGAWDLRYLTNMGISEVLQADLGLDREDQMWFHPTDANHQRFVKNSRIYRTLDAWTSVSNAGVIGSGPYNICPQSGNNINDILVGISIDSGGHSPPDYHQPHVIGYLYGEDDLTPIGIAGKNCNLTPFTDSIPYNCGGICTSGIGLIGT